MATGIIVVDVPERCSMCRYMYRTDEDYCFCKVERYGFDWQVNEFMSSKPKGKPNWCPIRPLTCKKEVLRQPHSMGDFERKGFARGWNACIDEIMKEEVQRNERSTN